MVSLVNSFQHLREKYYQSHSKYSFRKQRRTLFQLILWVQHHDLTKASQTKTRIDQHLLRRHLDPEQTVGTSSPAIQGRAVLWARGLGPLKAKSVRCLKSIWWIEVDAEKASDKSGNLPKRKAFLRTLVIKGKSSVWEKAPAGNLQVMWHWTWKGDGSVCRAEEREPPHPARLCCRPRLASAVRARD